MRGILFRPEMILAISQGKKTITRRVMKPQPFFRDGVLRWIPKKGIDINLTDHSDLAVPFAKYQVGEIVYIKEAWATEQNLDHLLPSEIGEAATVPLWYKADAKDSSLLLRGKWRSPLFMPAWSARDFIQITGVRPERLQEITHSPYDHDCHAEGFSNPSDLCLDDFMVYWDSINPNYPWVSNPWLFRYEFKRVTKDGREVSGGRVE